MTENQKYGPVFTPDGSRIAYTKLSTSTSGGTLLWDTWTVPVLGGQPTRFLPNASGLTWMPDKRVLFSEIMNGTSLHMGIVTATEGRAESREIYFPPHENGMAHYSYASPDLKSVLVVEMDQSHAFPGPAGCCRLMEVLRDERSGPRALALPPHGLRMESGCILAHESEARLTCGVRSFLMEPRNRSPLDQSRKRALQSRRMANLW